MRLDRVAAAPISWRVCEVRGWGVQLDSTLVLSQLRELGLQATEFGPVGFLPDDLGDKAALLASYHPQAVGEFLPVVLPDEDQDPLPQVCGDIDACRAAGADVMLQSDDANDPRPDVVTSLDHLREAVA